MFMINAFYSSRLRGLFSASGQPCLHNLFKKIIACSLLASFAFFPVQFLKKKEESKWFPFYIPWNYGEGSRIDMSFLLDAPSGKHGFLTVKDGHFYFEDGKRARFWGINIHSDRACFPTHSQAEDIAKRLAQLGCNIVRMHFLDYEAPAGVIDTRYKDSQHFSDSQMERLDYFIYQLKQNGIYTCFDVLGLGARRFKAGDGVPAFKSMSRGARGISFFNKQIIELSKKFAFDFLTHVNPYTGNSYLNEPAIAMVEMTNENTLFLKSSYRHFPPYYKKEIQLLWEEWLKAKNKEVAWGNKRWSDDKEFLFELQDQYQKAMYKYLRSIGVKVPIAASNVPYDNLTLLTDSQMDFVDIHVYWDLSDKLDRIHNRPLIKQNHLNPRTLINTMAIAKVHNKPLVFTEWGSLWPNDWRAVDILSTASYARLNDWDALFLYAYNGGWGMSWDNLEERLYYGTVVFNDPAKMGLFPLASLIFLRGDVSQASNTYTVSYNVKDLFDIKDTYKDRSRIAGIPYISRLEKRFYEAKSENTGAETNYPTLKELSTEDGEVVSDTGEVVRNSEKGIFILKTPRMFSFSGFVGEGKTEEFNGVRFYSDASFATFTITSLDGQDISTAGHLLLAVVGRVRNKGQKFTPHITKAIDDLDRDVYVISTGSGPILVESIEGEIFLKKTRRNEALKVFVLDEKGIRKSEIPVVTDNEGFSFKIPGDTIYYEILRI